MRGCQNCLNSEKQDPPIRRRFVEEFWTKFCKILKKYCLNRQGNSSKPCLKDLKDLNFGYVAQVKILFKSRLWKA